MTRKYTKDAAERWLEENDPEHNPNKRKKLEYPYLSNHQMEERIGTAHLMGKELPLSNLDAFKEELGYSDRNQQRRRKIQNIRDQML